MTQRLAESQAEVADYQRTLEEKVAQRTKELEIATAHAYKLAQHDILTGLPNRVAAQPAPEADSRAGAARSARTSPASSSISTTSSASTTRWATTPATSCCRRSRSGSATRCASPTPSRASGGDEFVVILPGLDPAHATFEIDGGADARARVVPRAVPARRPDAHADLLDRRVDVSDSMPPIRSADQAGRYRDVRGQGRRPQRLPLLHRRHERARAGAAAARDRHAPRPDGRRVLPRLPAADRDVRPDAPAASRRCCAGAIRSAASSRRRNSSRSPRSPG